MSDTIQWPPIGGSSYNVPEAGETFWPDLRDFIIALASAQGTKAQKVAARIATTATVTVDPSNDFLVVIDRATPGATTVNLPLGSSGQALKVIDGKGDAKTNIITVNATGGHTINGQPNVEINTNYGGLSLIKVGTDWKIDTTLVGIDGVTPFWLEPFDTVVDLPVSGEEGQFVYVKSPGALYTWNGSSWVIFSGGGGGGGSGVDAVNGYVGVVVLDSDDIGEGTTNLYYTAARMAAIQSYADGQASAAQAAAISAAATAAAALYEPKITTLPINKGGTGQSTASAALDALLPPQAGQSGKVLQTNGVTAAWQTVSGGGGGPANTDALPEGSTNLYYTNARSDARITLQKGAANGLATLDGASKLTASQLPTITKADVGLGNVDNTSDATKNAAVATLTNKTLTSPVINSPTGLVKGDVGLGNVDNTSDAAKPVSTAQQTAIDNAGLKSVIVNTSPVTPTLNRTLLVNTGAARVINVPTGVLGDKILIADNTGQAATNNITVNFVGGTQVIINANRGWFESFHNGTTWEHITPGVGAGGGGGLTGVQKTADYTIQPNEMVECDTTSGPIVLTLPVTTAACVVGFLDRTNKCSNTNYIRLAPATGDSIDTYAANDTATWKAPRSQAVLYKAAGSTNWGVAWQNTTGVNGGMVPANPSSTGAAAGSMGYRLLASGTGVGVNTGTYTTIASALIPAGDTDIYWSVQVTQATGLNAAQGGISTANNSSAGLVAGISGGFSAANAVIGGYVSGVTTVRLSAPTTYYLVAATAGANSTATGAMYTRSW